MERIWEFSTKFGEVSYQVFFDVEQINRFTAEINITVMENDQGTKKAGTIFITVNTQQKSSQVTVNFTDFGSLATGILLCLVDVGRDVVNECLGADDFVACLKSKGIPIGREGLTGIARCPRISLRIGIRCILHR